MRLAMITCALALSLTACTGTINKPNSVPVTSNAIAEVTAITSERAYTVATITAPALVLSGKVTIATVRQTDAIAYASLVAGRMVHDVLYPVSDDLAAARDAADLAHTSIMRL